MAEITELEKMQRSVDYCHRYFEFENAIAINQQNREYLKSYIHDSAWVEEDFNLSGRIATHKKNFIICAVVAFILFLMIMFAVGLDWILILIISAAAALAAFGISLAIIASLEKIHLKEAKEYQLEVNDGIKEQIEALAERDNLLIAQKNNYYKALKEREDCVIPVEYIKYSDELLKYLKDGEAENCEDAIFILEQKLLMKELEVITNAPAPPVVSNNEERFGDPLKLISTNQKKKKGFLSKITNKLK